MVVDDLFAAIEAGELDRAGALTAADPTLLSARGAGGLSPLLAALYRNRLDMAGALRAAAPGYPLDVFEAAALGDEPRLRGLLGSDLALANAYSPDGYVPLSLAAYFGQVGTVEILLKAGADPLTPARTDSGVQPLHAATAASNFAAVDLLLAAGADPDARQQGGWTPLMAAAARGDEATVNRLLDAGANPTLRNDHGLDSADLAAGHGFPSVADHLAGAVAAWRASHRVIPPA